MSFIKSVSVLTLVYFTSTLGVSLAGVMSIGPQGIDSVGLPRPGGGVLTGLGAKIGQVEERRPTDVDVDTELIENPTINPAAVWFVDEDAVSTDQKYSDHATAVAGVMISTDGAAKGVATGASLYASAFAPLDVIAPTSNVLLSMQHVATASGGVRAMNLSFGREPGDSVDGLSPITAGVDWLATRYHFLPVSAGNETVDATRSPPTDNFNGITVGASKKRDNVYRQVADFNRFDADAEGDRVSVDLLAPGEDIELTGLFGDPIPDENSATDGTSFAAPHVVAIAHHFRTAAGAG